MRKQDVRNQQPSGLMSRPSLIPPARPEPKQFGWFGGMMYRFRQVFLGDDAFLTGQIPLEPKEPPGEPPRKLQYQPGYNIQIQPRSDQPISFSQIRNLADSCDLVRIVIERCKNALGNDEWDIVPREHDLRVPETRLSQVKKFWEKPDKRHLWDEWLGMLLEDMLVPDAASVYVRRTRGGDVWGFDLIDGTTIKPLIDYQGYEPEPPTPAYQQFLYGVPYAAFTKEELCYRPRVRRTSSLYGFSPVEQIILTVNMAIRRVLYNLGQLNEGTVPTGIGTLPKDWTLEQIEKWQSGWDSWLAGDPINRSRIKWGPEGMEIHKFKDDEVFQLWNEFDEWLARVICYAFGVSYAGFVKMTNRSASESAERQEQEQGLGGYRLWVQRLVNKLIWEHMHIEDVKFEWVSDHAHNAKLRIERNVAYATAGIMLVNEIRSEEGYPPIEEVAEQFGVPVPTPQQAGGATGISGGNAMPDAGSPAEPAHQSDSGPLDHADAAADKKLIESEIAAHKAAMTVDLDKWCRKVVNNINKSRADLSFESRFIPEDVKAGIYADLRKGPQTVAEIRHIFARRKKNAIRIPAPRQGDGAEERTKLRALLHEVGMKVVDEEASA